MRENIIKSLKVTSFFSLFVFVVFCLFRTPVGYRDLISYAGYSVAISSALFVVYEKWLWKYIPLNRPPILMKEYKGKILFKFNGRSGEKSVAILTNQSWLTVAVKAKTDINSSSTIVSTIVKEHGENVLYYTYMTNPSAATQKNNPIQYGTCRMVLEGDNQRLKGKYWTSSNTTGDIEWWVD